ncbi:Cysteine dioxygenase type 1, partial [Tetrabaena socialis]
VAEPIGRPQPQPPRYLGALLLELRTAFSYERGLGHSLGNRQDAASSARLDSNVRALLQAYSCTNTGDWRQYAEWGDHSYLRHLLWCDEEFEVMVLCWKPGQASRVHNHADSHCWLAVLDGKVHEQQYRRIAREQDGAAPEAPWPPGCEHGAPAADGSSTEAPGDIELEPTRTNDLTAGDVGYINDLIALHSIGAGDGEEPSCTLHVYSPPIRRVKTYEGGKEAVSVPGFFSRHSVVATP